MTTVRTHYDNLKVARDAPIEVIRAAYKSLSLKYHPDRNGGNPESERVMKIINISYEVLSDPVRRAEHDLWIFENENPPAPINTVNNITDSALDSQNPRIGWVSRILAMSFGLMSLMLPIYAIIKGEFFYQILIAPFVGVWLFSCGYKGRSLDNWFK